jgi:type I restriction enzyme M protein
MNNKGQLLNVILLASIDNCQVEAIISMAAGIFTPYAGVATSIMIFTKGERTEKVWLYAMAADDYSLDVKIMPTPDNNDISNNSKCNNSKQIDNINPWTATYDQIFLY